MYAIVIIGSLTVVLSLMMIANPAGWSCGILRFSEKSYFHIAEILIRFGLGGVLLLFADGTMFPLLIKILGCGLILVGFSLIIMGRRRHVAFAEKSATFTKIFRPAGFASLAFGVFLIYISLL